MSVISSGECAGPPGASAHGLSKLLWRLLSLLPVPRRREMAFQGEVHEMPAGASYVAAFGRLLIAVACLCALPAGEFFLPSANGLSGRRRWSCLTRHGSGPSPSILPCATTMK